MNLETYLELLAKFEKSKDIQAYTAYLLPKLKVVHDTVKHNLQDSNVMSKSSHDRKSQKPLFELGAKVLLHNPTTKKVSVQSWRSGEKVLLL